MYNQWFVQESRESFIRFNKSALRFMFSKLILTYFIKSGKLSLQRKEGLFIKAIPSYPLLFSLRITVLRNIFQISTAVLWRICSVLIIVINWCHSKDSSFTNQMTFSGVFLFISILVCYMLNAPSAHSNVDKYPLLLLLSFFHKAIKYQVAGGHFVRSIKYTEMNPLQLH